jgi:16S rRNA (uracil1498-N3)-methyltransferase
VGQQFDIATSGRVRHGRIVAIHDHRVEFELGEDVATAAELRLTLVMAIFKFDRMEWALEKCTELGVAAIVPVVAQRTDAHLAAASAKRRERWLRIVAQAAEQSRRHAPPRLDLPVKLKDAMALPGATRIVLAESEQDLSLRDAIESRQVDGELVMAIGPEGGWTPTEQRLFAEAGWLAASLGHTILRSETAAIAAVSIATAQFE